jgi:hypothetical protein
LLCGPPGSSKTNTLKNILLRQKWDNVYLVHVSKNSKEWDDWCIPPENRFEEIPPIDFFDHDKDEKSVIILEDYHFPTKSKQRDLSNLVRYVSTHTNTTVCTLYQEFLSVPVIVRRCANVFVIWDVPDKNQLNLIGKRVGLGKGELAQMVKDLCPHKRDSLCFDLTVGSPYPIRRNIFEPVKRVTCVTVDNPDLDVYEVDEDA